MYFKLFFQCIFSNFLVWKILLVFCLCYCLLCPRGNNHFDVLFRRIGPVLFPSKDGDDAVYEGKNTRKGVYFPPKSAFFPFVDNMIEVLFPFFTLMWRVNKYVSRQGKGINSRNESINIAMYICSLWYCIHFLKTLTACFH